MRVITLHLSDIHIKDVTTVETAKAHLIASVVTKHSINPKVEKLLVIVSGDISFSGKKEQYLVAIDYFETLKKEIINNTGIDDIQFLFVPGNHDVDFKDKNEVARDLLIKGYNDGMIVDDNFIDLTLKGQSKFWEFVNYFSGITFEKSLYKIIGSKSINYYGKNISIILLNSSWGSSLKEQPNQLPLLKNCMNEYIMSETFKLHQEADIRIAFMHHPYKWFNEESASFLQETLEEYSDIIMLGHEHFTSVYLKDNYSESKEYYVHGAALVPPDMSGSAFNIIEFDLENMTENFYCYYKGIDSESYSIAEDPIIDRKLITGRYKTNNIHMKAEFEEYLADLGCTFNHKYAGKLSIEDIFVWPDLEKAINRKSSVVIDQDEFLKCLIDEKKLCIKSSELRGKTILSKKIHSIYLENHIIPVFVKGKNIQVGGLSDIRNFLEQCYSEQFELRCIDKILQSKSSKKAIIIEDFDLITLSKDSFEQFFEAINQKYDYIILTISDETELLNYSNVSSILEEVQQDYTNIEIMESGRRVLDNLVRKWLSLSNQDYGLEGSVEFDQKVYEIAKKVISVQNESLFDNTILSQLTILSVLDSQSNDKSIGQYAHVYEPLILMQVNKAFNYDANDVTIALEVFASIAHRVYVTGENNPGYSFTEDLISDANRDYYEAFGERIPMKTFIDLSIRADMLVATPNNLYKFRYNYIYYFFTSRALYNNPIDISILYNDIYYEPNANILLFLAYEYGNNENPVLDELISRVDQMYLECQEFDFKDVFTFTNYAQIKEIIEFQRMKSSDVTHFEEVDNNREEHLISIDKNNKKRRELLDKEIEDDELEALNRLSSSLRTLKIITQILKNYSPKIKTPKKTDAIIKSTKLLMRISYYISLKLENSLLELEQLQLEKNEKFNYDKPRLYKEITRYLTNIWERVIISSIMRSESLVDKPSLVELFETISMEEDSTFFDIVSIYQKVEVMNGKLPLSEVEAFKKKYKGKYLPHTVLYNLLLHSMSIKKFDYKDRAKMLSIIKQEEKIQDVLLGNAKKLGR